ncbi:RNA polymerase sigma factor [Stackebrandtia soli]|uniref:RNA polymerase sigma factor n=1 Tax=Stackebrandtia soli TaxID=1892856 RepID=UPI0039EA48C6
MGTTMPSSGDENRTNVEHLLRGEAPQVLGALVRRFGRFDVAEDAVQEAFLAASRQWRDDGTPDDPRAWLIRVAYRRMIDRLRSEQAERRRQLTVAHTDPRSYAPERPGPAAIERDDSLNLFLLCCHPVLSVASQIALTLRAVGGLRTVEIAHAYGVTEQTMGTRISRAKQQLKRSGARFELTDADDARRRVDTVMRVLYLVFNEGYTTSAGNELSRADLTLEAIRLSRMLCELMPQSSEAQGLLALMLLTEARRPARMDVDHELVPMSDQDRGRWDRDMIAEGVTLIEAAWRRDQVGGYQLQAAIAAVHAEATGTEDTDWPQIAALYLWLERLEPTAPVRLSRVVAVAHAYGPQRGLALLDELDRAHGLSESPLVTGRVPAVRAHLLDLVGERARARDEYLSAAERTGNTVEQRYLRRRAEQD